MNPPPHHPRPSPDELPSSRPHTAEVDFSLDAELRQLPLLKAPPSLRPRVLARLRVAPPWWQRSWFSWPVPARLASAVSMLSLMGLVLYLEQRLSLAPGLPSLWQNFTLSGLLQGWLAPVLQLGQAPLGVLQSYGIGLPHLLAILATLYLATIGLGSAWFHVAAAERSRSRSSRP